MWLLITHISAFFFKYRALSNDNAPVYKFLQALIWERESLESACLFLQLKLDIEIHR